MPTRNYAQAKRFCSPERDFNLGASVLQSEVFLRAVFLLPAFILFAAFEAIWPRRKRAAGRPYRWVNNIAIFVVSTAMLRVLSAVGAIGLAYLAETRGLGILHLFEIPPLATIVLSIFLLDLAVYGQHVLYHVVPLLWRIHRVHHTDVDMDVTTGLRFHPVGILIGASIDYLVIVALGAPAIAVFIFQIAAATNSMFKHSNLTLSHGLDVILRRIVVTPDMHRVHHSAIRSETDSNYGIVFSWWDFLFGTYIAQPRNGHEHMRIGLSRNQSLVDSRLDRMLWQPFVSMAQTNKII